MSANMTPMALPANAVARSLTNIAPATAAFHPWIFTSVSSTAHMPSFYDVIRQCNKFEKDVAGLWEFHLLDNLGPVGYMLPEFVAKMRWEGTGFHVSKSEHKVHLSPRVGQDDDVVDICRKAFVGLCEKNVGVLGGVTKWLRKKVDYHPIRGFDGHLAGLKMPSPLRGIFGIVTTGVHMNVYTMKKVDGRPRMHIWVSRRSENVTYAGKLDQVVAGAMDPMDLMDPLRTLRREAMEEARLAIDIKSRRVTTGDVFVGMVLDGSRISFYDKKDSIAGAEQGQLEPGIRFTFDLEIDSSFVPQPGEPGAIAGFLLKPVDDVKRDLKRAEWKPNCGLVMLDFLLRKGQIKPEDDDRYGLLREGLQRELPFQNI
ncbi:Uncharacterized protein TPAR_00013 [Tolypocladium paradoxum]|uniref:Thiamine pyrophosphokinase n=1 Tax=Tolypocladium paradoxum TaxID=94208 RepID=A0A2S4LBJ0_9HYPO|nr:Uncharacterized protein TPAR_00013 [Tolypocladium paradoxum]